MPTRGRSAYALEALYCFIGQTWQEKELVIVDDADDRSFQAGVYVEGVQYHLIERRLTVGAKRNLACDLARGEIILHWDDDDWSAPGRIEDQVVKLVNSGADISGYCRMRFHDVERDEWWQYHSSIVTPLGTSLCYRKELLRRHRFEDRQNGEDTIACLDWKVCVRAFDARDLMYARTHAGNTAKRNTTGDSWRKIS